MHISVSPLLTRSEWLFLIRPGGIPQPRCPFGARFWSWPPFRLCSVTMWWRSGEDLAERWRTLRTMDGSVQQMALKGLAVAQRWSQFGTLGFRLMRKVAKWNQKAIFLCPRGLSAASGWGEGPQSDSPSPQVWKLQAHCVRRASHYSGGLRVPWPFRRASVCVRTSHPGSLCWRGSPRMSLWSQNLRK